MLSVSPACPDDTMGDADALRLAQVQPDEAATSETPRIIAFVKPDLQAFTADPRPQALITLQNAPTSAAGDPAVPPPPGGALPPAGQQTAMGDAPEARRMVEIPHHERVTTHDAFGALVCTCDQVCVCVPVCACNTVPVSSVTGRALGQIAGLLRRQMPVPRPTQIAGVGGSRCPCIPHSIGGGARSYPTGGGFGGRSPVRAPASWQPGGGGGRRVPVGNIPRACISVAATAPPVPASSGGGGGGGGSVGGVSVCTCDLVCTCVPVAH